MTYDLIIVGAGPAGIFAALEAKKLQPSLRILMLEKGKPIEKRICPKRATGVCVNCNPCHITTGFAGGGAYSDGKLSLCPEVGGVLPDYIGYEETEDLIRYVDQMYQARGADTKIYGVGQPGMIEKVRRKAIESNLKLIECPIRHLGTEVTYRIYSMFQKELQDLGVDLRFNSPVQDLLVSDGQVRGVLMGDESFYGEHVAVAVGREGSEWFQGVSDRHGVATVSGTVDIGVRVETRNEVMRELNEAMYETKLVYYTPTFDDKVRTFCTNPGGEVVAEYYDGHLAVVNGHSYKAEDRKTANTNFALLVSKNFTEPFRSPIEYGKYIARLGNMLAGNKILVQRYGDFRRGRRTTVERLHRNNITPTLKDSVPGDLSLVLPYRIMKDIDEMILALDHITPGLASDETLLYGVEVKFYSNKVMVEGNFETTVRNLHVLGDGAGITRGLIQANCNGIQFARRAYS
jgi:uncharacterized protein